MPNWLSRSEVPLFVSHRRLKRYKRLPQANCRWALDSGGFTELSMFGEWRTTPEEYVDAVRRYRDEIGKLEWASPQDWMCEPWIVANTGLSVAEHQRRTVDNYLRLRELAPDVNFVPAVQGDDLPAYLRCIELYDAAGVDLTKFETVGIGSVCRRQATSEIGEIVSTISGLGISIHGYGVKSAGLKKYGKYLTSADSMAWSFRGRHVTGCEPGHKTEANCYRFALQWRERALQSVEGG